MGADFTPDFNGLPKQDALKFWCQKILPLVYDDSLSYYELLCKVVGKLNECIGYIDTTVANVTGLYEAYQHLQEYVNNYFDNLDVQTEIDNKLEEMLSRGELLVQSFNGRTGNVVPQSGDYTAAQVGAVNKAGDTMTGNLTFVKDDASAVLGNDGNEFKVGNSKGGKYEELVLTDPTVNTLANLFQIARWDGASRTLYNIFHTGNKPSGSYTGNGSATQREIAVNGIGNCIVLFGGGNEVAIATSAGAIYSSGGVLAHTPNIAFNGNTLFITSSDALNTTGYTYHYQVL